MKRLTALILLLVLINSCALCESDAAIWDLPNKSQALHEDMGRINTTKVTQITGQTSTNKTMSRFGVWGTDLGSMTEMNGKVYMFCGDTFSTADCHDWRSNVLFIIEDDDPSDGLTITGAITDKNGKAIELLTSAKIDNIQKTIIPTNIFAVDNTLYCIYMSVKVWGADGEWICGFSGLAKSTDEGQTWTKLDDVKWPGDSNFIQTAHYILDDTIYLWGIPSGRFDGVALMKVKTSELENFEAYEYFVGTDESGAPQWIKGAAGIRQAQQIIGGHVGEISVIYNEYLGNFMITYLNHDQKAIVMREGVTPWGPWGKEHLLTRPFQYTLPYGGFMLPRYVENKGQTVYFGMSVYFPVYNILWMKAELPALQ